MTTSRSVEDRLRAEYFDLQSDITRALLETETRVRHALLPLTLALRRYERILITSRVKDCESAVDALRRRQEFGLFDAEKADSYSLTSLRNLAGVRVMAFPRNRIDDVSQALVSLVSSWTPDPVPAVAGENQPLALKYFGKWNADDRITAGIQIVSLLIGLFWEVEHSAIYKPNPNLQGVARSFTMIERRNEVVVALHTFEDEFARQIADSEKTL